MEYLILFLTFCKISLFTVGGGLAMLPLVQQEAISQGWLNEAEFINVLAVSQSTPGPIGINLATYVGFIKLGPLGALVATLGMIIPCGTIAILIAKFLVKYQSSKYIEHALLGIRPAVAGMICSAAYFVIKISVFTPTLNGSYIVSFLFVLFVLMYSFIKVHPVVFILLGALLGIILL